MSADLARMLDYAARLCRNAMREAGVDREPTLEDLAIVVNGDLVASLCMARERDDWTTVTATLDLAAEWRALALSTYTPEDLVKAVGRCEQAMHETLTAAPVPDATQADETDPPSPMSEAEIERLHADLAESDSG